MSSSILLNKAFIHKSLSVSKRYFQWPVLSSCLSTALHEQPMTPHKEIKSRENRSFDYINEGIAKNSNSSQILWTPKNAQTFHINPRIDLAVPPAETQRIQGEMDITKEFPPEDPSSVFSIPDFTDPRSAYETKSLLELLRALAVFRLCRIRPLVKNADKLLGLSNKVLGTNVTDALVKSTFFNQFCAGEDAERIRPITSALESNGIGSILDYAAESDVEDVVEENHGEGIVSQPPYNQPARVYSYQSEAVCNNNLEVFKSCVRAVRDVSPSGFAAVKVTALGNPCLLERMSIAIEEAKKLFSAFDTNHDGVLTHDEFKEGYRTFFKDADIKLPEILDRLDPNNNNSIDYIEWSKFLTPCDLPRITSSARSKLSPLCLATPSQQEIELMHAMHLRADALASEASKYGVRLLVDAEQTRYQPAIDNIALLLQQKYNKEEVADRPIVFNTYQCYLKDMPRRMMGDLERSRRYSYRFGAKLVRGAYMMAERERAMRLGIPSPIHDTIEDTHKCFDSAFEYLLRYRFEHDSNLEVMCATHNRASILKAIELMNELGIQPHQQVVHFAQLLGMSDNLTYPLGKHGYRVYKYVPYGNVHEVIPYLLRRAQENADMLEKVKEESRLVIAELRRRLLHVV